MWGGGICSFGGPSFPHSLQPVANAILEIPYVILSSVTPRDYPLYNPMGCHKTQSASFILSLFYTPNQMIYYSMWQGSDAESGNSLP